MKTLFYFHGLESKQGGEKVSYLTKHFLTHAPEMVYKEPDTWPYTLAKVQKQKPQVVVGSSMGGLMSFFSGYNTPCKMLLFNPAFDRIPQYIADWKIEQQQRAEIEIVLGKNDTDVSPKFTMQYLEENKIVANFTMLDFEHRVSYELFEQQLERFINKFKLIQ